MSSFPLPGRDGRFPETRASIVEEAGSPDPGARERALQVLLRSYWSPVYKYLRLRGRCAPEEAEDLTQGFFVSLLERELVARYDASRGRFRTYLRACLDGYVANERKAAGRRKRGGGAPHVPLDFETAEGEIRELPLTDGVDPDELFHREFVRGLFSRAVDALREECEAADRPRRFALFRRYDLEGPDADERPTYASLAREFGMEVTQVTNELHAARKRFRERVLEELRAVTATEAEFREEARALLGADAA